MLMKFKRTSINPLSGDTKAINAENIHYQAVFGTDSDSLSTSLSKDGGTQLLNARQITQIWAVSPTVNRAVDIISGQIASTPFGIRVRTNKNKAWKDDPSHNFLEYLHYGSTKYSGYGIIKATVAWLKLYNRAYWAIEPTTKREQEELRAPTRKITVLNPQYCKVVPSKDGSTGWDIEYNVNESSKKLYKYKDVIIFSDFSPNEDSSNYYYPTSNLNSLEYDIQVERFGKRMTFNYFDKSLHIDAVIKSAEQMGDEELRKIRSEVDSQYKANTKGRFGRTLILSGSTDYIQPKSVELPTSVVQMLEQTASNHAMVMGVPVPLLTGVHGGQSKDLLQYEAMMWKQTLIPICENISKTINRYLRMTKSNQGAKSETDYEFYFDLSTVASLREEFLNVTRTDIALLTTGAITVNEWRMKNGYQPLEGEAANFGNMPTPVYNAQVQAEAAKQSAQARTSPSMSLPNDPNGRDQSDTGEAQMPDTTGLK